MEIINRKNTEDGLYSTTLTEFSDEYYVVSVIKKNSEADFAKKKVFDNKLSAVEYFEKLNPQEFYEQD